MNDKRYALIASQVWDGVSNRAERGLAVIIRGARIESICAVDSVPRDVEARTFADGSTLLPGLIDAHVHYSPWMGPAFLSAGVTTIRDTGNDLDWILAQQTRHRQDIAAGPEIVPCGVLLDGPRPYWHFIGRGHSDPQALRETIRQQAARGVRFAKFYDGLDDSFIRAGAEEARQLGLWVLSDFGTDEPKAESAIRAGVNEIEHLTGCPAAWHNCTQDDRDRMIDVLHEYRVAMVPTLITYEHIGRALDLAFQFDRRRQWAHPSYHDIWRRIPRIHMEARKDQRHKFQEAAVHQKRFVGRMHERGVTIGAGTDSPFSNILPGFGLHDELSMLVDAGLPPVAALRSATSVNAGIVGQKELIGQIQAGFDADLLIVAGDPLENIHHIARTECMVRKGTMLVAENLKERSADECRRALDDPITRDLLRYLASVQDGTQRTTS